MGLALGSMALHQLDVGGVHWLLLTQVPASKRDQKLAKADFELREIGKEEYERLRPLLPSFALDRET